LGTADKLSVARGLVEGFTTRDQARLLSLFSPDVEFWTRVLVLSDHHFQGHDAVREWLRSVEEQFDRFEIVEAEYLTGTDDTVLIAGRISMQGAGENYGQQRAVHWVIRVDETRGVITSFQSFGDDDEARQAAGLSDASA
jgi:ketosteroid isomerase-like protein